jgi:hypothetical protein
MASALLVSGAKRRDGMAQPEIRRTLDVFEPASARSLAAQTNGQAADDSGVTNVPDISSQEASIGVAKTTHFQPPPYFNDALQDAERLMTYAAEVGIDVGADVRNAVLVARSRSSDGWDEQTAANLLTALTKLAAQLRPVTAESLNSCSSEERHAVRAYWKWALGLALVIVPFSVASFVTSALADAIRKDIGTANELAVKLTAQLRSTGQQETATLSVGTPDKPASEIPSDVSPIDVVTELQQFAATIRSVDRRARQLQMFVRTAHEDPFAASRLEASRPSVPGVRSVFELPADLSEHPKAAATDRIEVYQKVRSFAQGLVDDVSVFYSAMATCILPVLYALLGTCAYLLRSFEDQMKTKTFTMSVANSARFLIAGIGGAVVGLFNNFSVTQGASIPPLAVAFLVGYAVDVFFAFLDSLLQSFTRARSGMNAPAPTPASTGRA